MKIFDPQQYETRQFSIERSLIGSAEDRTVTLAFSSEAPYERSWGREILDHSPRAMKLDRLCAGGPLLMDHDPRDHVGVIEAVEIGADRVARATVRFGRSARAEEVWRDVQDGIRRNASVGYIINDAVLVDDNADGGAKTYRVTDWEPLEVSLVSIPADASVGVGRSSDASPIIPPISESKHQMQNQTDRDSELRGVDAERKRVAEIINIGKQYRESEFAMEYAASGKTIDDFRGALLEKLATKPLPTAEIGMTEKQARQFSFLRAINALANPTDRKAQSEATFERECSDAVGKVMGRAAHGFFVPVEVQQRDLLVGTATAGGHTVATELLAANFIDLLRNRMVVKGLGAQILSGLVGNIAIPRQTGGGTAYWVAENGAPTESQQAFDQLTMSPKTVGAFTDISRKLLLQSSIAVESFVRGDLATVLALAIDLAAINGSGASNQPTGILNTSGIGSVAGGTNGAQPTWANMVDLETAVSIANADIGAMGYLTNAKMRGRLKSTQKTATYGDIFVWEGGAEGSGVINGYTAATSNQVPSNLTKGTSSGVCSAIIFGNFNDLLIGEWGALDLMVDPYTGATAGTVRVVALQDVDIAVRHVESFAAMKDAL